MSKFKLYFFQTVLLMGLSLLVIGWIYTTYLMLELIASGIISPDNIEDFPVNTFRIWTVIILDAAYLGILLTKFFNYVKSFLLSAPLTYSIIVLLTLNTKTPYLALSVVFVLSSVITVIAYLSQRRFYVYPVIILSVILGTYYAWPF